MARARIIMATHAQQLANCAGLRAPPRSRRTAKSVRAPVRAQAFPQGGSNGDGGSNASHSWSPHRKQLVEALTAGSGLARAPSVWYVDKDDDTLRMPASLLADAPSAASTSAPEGSTRNDGLPVVRVNARQVGVSHRAIAHGDSSDASSLRGELERHIKGGGATVDAVGATARRADAPQPSHHLLHRRRRLLRVKLRVGTAALHWQQ